MTYHRVLDNAAKAEFQRFIDARYSGLKSFVEDPHGGEIVAEMMDYEFAVAAIYQTLPHWHQHTFESYEILKGKLAVVVAGHVTLLEAHSHEPIPGQQPPTTRVDIVEGRIHWAYAMSRAPAYVRVKSNPRWTKEDHHVAPQDWR
jgi:hypothetical protein